MKALIAISVALALTACAPNYSEGSRVGVVTKLSNKGLIWKSWEGTLNQGGLKNVTDAEGHTRTVANAIDFNASEPDVIRDLQDAMNTGRTVELVYREWLIPPLSITNSRVITAVKPTK